MYVGSLAREQCPSLEILGFYLCKNFIIIPEGMAQIKNEQKL